MKKTQSVRNMNKPWSWKVTQGEKLSEEQPQCESESRLETKLAALPHHFTQKAANNNAQSLHASHSDQPCKMIQTSQHPHWGRNMCFLMSPCMTWNTVPLGGHAHSHTIEHAAPPSQHFIEQTRTITGRHFVALATHTLRRLHRGKNQRRSRHVSLRQRCARWTHHRRLQWRNTLTNKQTRRTRSTNRTYDIETQLLVKTFARTTSMQEPEHTNCFNSQPPRLRNTKMQTHTNKQFEFYKLRMIRRSWKTTSSRSAETKRDIRQLAQHIAQTQSDELRCNHNTLMGLHWWTRRTANTPRNTCTCQFQLGHVSEGRTRNDLVTWLSEKGCWMNSSWTSGLKQTNMKKTQNVRNMNKTSIMIHLIEQERTTNPHCEDTVAPATLSLRSRCREINQIWFGHAALRQKVLDELIMDVFTTSKQSSKQTKKQTRMWPKRLLREMPSDEILDQQQSEIWLVEPDPSGPTRKRHNATTLHATDRHRADRMSRVPSSSPMLGLGRQICHHHAQVDSKSICSNKRCDRDVGNFLLHWRCGAAATSIRSRSGCCLYRLPHLCSALRGKSVIMQSSTQKPFVPTKDVTVTLGIWWQFLLHKCCGAKAVGNDLDEPQNWLLSVLSSPSMLRLGRQICHHAEVGSKTMCTDKWCDRDVGHQMATCCYTGVAVQKRLAVISISSRTGCCLYRLSHQCSAWRGKSVIMQTSREFVKMKIWNLQSLLVCPIILWRVSSTEDDWIFGWLSRLASLILNLCLSLTLFHCGWVKRFFSSGTPWIQFLRIRCWRGRNWICKNVSRLSMHVPNAWRPFSAARHSYRAAHYSFRNWMGWEWHWSTGNVIMSTAYWFRILKISWVIHTINFIFAIPVSCQKVPK